MWFLLIFNVFHAGGGGGYGYLRLMCKSWWCSSIHIVHLLKPSNLDFCLLSINYKPRVCIYFMSLDIQSELSEV